ncbi:MAG: type pilus assembly protein PilB, partial [Thermoleophilaceae bacterium]|nr:type pilus assembly protein PilB [Thermoleophilaceae bacterium]
MSPETSTAVPPPPKGVIPPSEPGGRSGFLSDVIVELGFATADAVEAAVREARAGTTVAQVLVASGAISEEQAARATAERYGLAYIDLSDFEVDAQAAALIRPSAAKRYQAVPVGLAAGALLVAMTDPADSLALNDIAVMTKLEVQPAATTRSGLEALLARLAEAAEGDAPAASSPKPAASSAVFWQAGSEAGDALPASDAELTELRRKLVGAEAELVKARAELGATEADLTTARASATGSSAEQAQLITELTAAREAAEQANTEVAELRAQVASAESELADLRESAARAADADAAREAAQAELATERERAAARAAAIESELTTERERAAARLAAAEAELAAERDAAAARVAAIEADLAAARENASAPQAEVEALREQLTAATA